MSVLDPSLRPVEGPEMFGPPDRSTIRTIESTLVRNNALSKRGCKFSIQHANRYYWTKQVYHGRAVTMYPLVTEFRIEDVPIGIRRGVYPVWLPRTEPFDGGNASGGKAVLGGEFDRFTGRLVLTMGCR